MIVLQERDGQNVPMRRYKMPYDVKKFKDGWYVVKTTTGEKKNNEPYKSKEAALPYMRALYAHEGNKKHGRK